MLFLSRVANLIPCSISIPYLSLKLITCVIWIAMGAAVLLSGFSLRDHLRRFMVGSPFDFGHRIGRLCRRRGRHLPHDLRQNRPDQTTDGRRSARHPFSPHWPRLLQRQYNRLPVSQLDHQRLLHFDSQVGIAGCMSSVCPASSRMLAEPNLPLSVDKTWKTNVWSGPKVYYRFFFPTVR